MALLRVTLEFHVEQCLGLSSWYQPDLFDACFILFLEFRWNLFAKKLLQGAMGVWDYCCLWISGHWPWWSSWSSEGTLSRDRHWWQFCTGSTGCFVAFWILPVQLETDTSQAGDGGQENGPGLGESKRTERITESRSRLMGIIESEVCVFCFFSLIFSRKELNIHNICIYICIYVYTY